jgi:hypothetical protein
MPRIIVALNLPKRILDFIAYARFIAQRLRDDPRFAPPSPRLAILEANLAKLEAAQAALATRAPGTVSARDALREAVRADLHGVKLWVQGLADANPAEAASIIQAAGMSEKGSSGHFKGGFEVKQGGVSGSARLIAVAEKTRASYDWEYSTDGTSWIRLDSTVRANTTVEGLIPGKMYFFRYRTVTKAGTSNWSQVISLRVV